MIIQFSCNLVNQTTSSSLSNHHHPNENLSLLGPKSEPAQKCVQLVVTITKPFRRLNGLVVTSMYNKSDRNCACFCILCGSWALFVFEHMFVFAFL